MPDARRIALFALGLLVGFGAAFLFRHEIRPVPPQLVPTTIEAILSEPDKYAGHNVRVAGKLDECAGWECSICPESMRTETGDSKRCLALGFRPLLEGTGFGTEAKEAVFRFSSVILDAKFDPACLYDPCLDRAAVLTEANVFAVTQRRASRSGLWLGRRTALNPLTGQEGDRVEEAAYDAGFPKGTSGLSAELSRSVSGASSPPIAVFGVTGAATRAVACWAPLGTRDSLWPASLEGAIIARSVNDYYQCAELRKIKNTWVAQVTN